MEEIDFDNIFKIQMTGMKIIQCHPDTKHDIYWLLKTSIIFGLYTLEFYFVGNSMLVDIRNKDLLNAFQSAVPVSFYIFVMINYSFLINNSKSIGQMFKIMKSDYEKMPNLDQRCRSVIIDTTTKCSWILKYWSRLTTSCVVVFCLKSICLSIYYILKDQYEFVPLHEMHYPEFIEKHKKNNIYVFAFTYVAEFYFISLTILVYVCSTPLGPLFMLHACSQLELVKIKFEDIFKKDDVEKRLSDIVEDLQLAYGFIAEINKSFTIIYEIMMKEFSVRCPVTCYAFVKAFSHREFAVEHVIVIVATMIFTAMPCYYSDLLMSKGEEVRQAAYDCGWERVFNPGARKTLLIIVNRASNPTAVKSIFCTINLDTLTNVFRQAYTIFNLMCAMWD
uniref:Odorant receptor n=1 Tax=Dendrolimus punctatus TaxID=238572 RepID=A0A2K8GL43_9NEOP|nr:Odorant Receptor 20-2 [Dendrolimus punctatus]